MITVRRLAALLGHERRVLRFGVPECDRSDAPAWKRSIPWPVPRRAPNKRERARALPALRNGPIEHPIRLVWPLLELIEVHCLGCGSLLRIEPVRGFHKIVPSIG